MQFQLNLLEIATAAAIGIIPMVFIQICKPYVRPIYFRAQIRSWFKKRYDKTWHSNSSDNMIARENNETDNYLSCEKLYGKFINLMTADINKSVFRLSIEQLCGQISTVAQLILSKPENNISLISCLSGRETRDAKNFANFIKQGEGEPGKVNRDSVAMRTELSHYIQRSIDSLQITISFLWQQIMLLASFLISFLIFIIIYVNENSLNPNSITCREMLILLLL
jgi:hypothetical protein